MRVHYGNAVRLGDFVYASSGDFGTAPFTALDIKTGKIAWRDRTLARASLLSAEGRLILLDEDGNLVLATPTPEGLKVHSKRTTNEHAGPSRHSPAHASTPDRKKFAARLKN